VTYPAADLVTDDAVVVVQHRPLVPFASWVADALRRCVETKRVLQLVTPADARITRPLRTVLKAPPAHWVVRTDDGFYDGLAGVELTWGGAAFVPDAAADDGGATRIADAFVRTPDDLGDVGDVMMLNLLVRHPRWDRTVLGGAVELLSEALCGAPPAGWGAAEPVTAAWDRDALTTAVRERGDRRTSVVVHTSLAAGATRTGFATLDVASVDGAVEESITMDVGGSLQDRPGPDGLVDLVGRLADRHPLESLIVLRGQGRPDLTVGPRWAGVPTPVGLALGAGPVRMLGRSLAFNPPEIAAKVVGGTDPAAWYALDGAEPAEGYERLQRLLRHLGIDPFGAGAVR
jgi:Family of unknown function (DUF6177)